MADQLEKFIRENRERLDTEEPSPGHEKRFKVRLTRDTGKKGSFMNNPMIRLAAMVIVGFMLGYFYYMSGPDDLSEMARKDGMVTQTANPGPSLESISPELSEAEFFFGNMIREKIEEIKEVKKEDSVSYNDIMKQLDALDKDYEGLKKELAHNQTNERIINAMIENYRLRLNILEHFATQIKTAKQYKSENHEEVEI